MLAKDGAMVLKRLLRCLLRETLHARNILHILLNPRLCDPNGLKYRLRIALRHVTARQPNLASTHLELAKLFI